MALLGPPFPLTGESVGRGEEPYQRALFAIAARGQAPGRVIGTFLYVLLTI